MNAKDQILKTTTPSGHGVHLCHKCGWPFPNPHPSAKHRRAHKKICGTIDGYASFIGLEVGSDGDKEKIHNVDISKVEASVDSSKSNFELTETNLVKDEVMGAAPDASQISYSQETNVVDEGEGKCEESQPSETIFKGVKDSELTKTSHEVSVVVGGDHDNFEQGDFEKLELESSIADGTSEGIKQETRSDCEHGSEVGNYETALETNIEKFELENEICQEVAKESEADHAKESEADHLEGVAEIKHEKSECDHKSTLEIAKEPKLEKSSKEQIQEVVKQPDTVLTEKEDLGGPHLKEQSNEHNHEILEKPDTVITRSQDLDASELEKCSREHVEVPDLNLIEKEDLGAPKSEKSSKDEVIEQKVDGGSSIVADVSVLMITPKFSSGNSVVNDKNASDVVHVHVVVEGKMTNQDSGAALSVDSSSCNSLEGNWGSVSALSTASIDAGTLQLTEKSKVNSGKSNAPSFMSLVNPKSKDKKPESQKQPNSEVDNESEGRKRNEEVIAKVTNWNTEKHAAPLKNLLSVQPKPMVQKDEDKKGKKVKGISSWFPFLFGKCC